MRFNHTKKTQQLISDMERYLPVLKSREISLGWPEFDDLKSRIMDDEVRKGVTDRIHMGGYVIKRIAA